MDNEKPIATIELDNKIHENNHESCKSENEILQEIKNWCENSTSHGIPKITRSKNKFLKLMWTLVFLASTTYCIIALIEDFQNYFKYAVLTFVDTEYEMPAYLPAITICGVNATMNETLKSCSIIRGARLNAVDCKSSDFVHAQVPEYSNCFIYNSGFNADGLKVQILTVNETGQKSGVKFEFKTTNSYGYDVFIHERGVCALSEQNINIMPKTLTEVGLKRTEMIKKEKPYSNCVPDKNIFPTETIPFFEGVSNLTRYSQKLCYSFCMKYNLGQYCSHAYSNVTQLYNSKKCQALPEILKMCSLKCPVECVSMIFSSTILTKNQQKSESVTILHVYYEETQYMRIHEVPAITPEAFIGNIGGELGLFVGISLLSLVEVIELFVNIGVILVKNYKKQKQINATPS